MKQIRSRLTYANVMSSLAVFLVLGGATAFAATQLAKNSVGTKQLKNNAVTTAKIKKNAVTTAKIKKAAVKQAKLAANSVGGSQIVNGAVTGDKIEVASTPFSRVVGTVSRSATQIWTGGAYSIGTYTQPAGEQDSYVGSVDVHFAASCAPPRFAQAQLTINSSNPASPLPWEVAGTAAVEDKGSGDVTRRVSVGPYTGGYAALAQAPPPRATDQTFSLQLITGSCNSGEGISIEGARVDVIGTRAG